MISTQDHKPLHMRVSKLVGIAVCITLGAVASCETGDSPTPAAEVTLSSRDVDTVLSRTGEATRVGPIGMSVSRFVRIDDRLLIGVCFDQPGGEGWQLGPATLSYEGGSSSSFMGTITSDTRGSADGRAGRQCNRLEFSNLPESADLSMFTLTVENVLLAAPDEGRECEVYSARLMRSAVLKQRGITARCKPEGSTVRLEVVSRSAGMSEADAHLLASQQAAGFVIGPWTFTDLPLTLTR